MPDLGGILIDGGLAASSLRIPPEVWFDEMREEV